MRGFVGMWRVRRAAVAVVASHVKAGTAVFIVLVELTAFYDAKRESTVQVVSLKLYEEHKARRNLLAAPV